MGKNDKTIRLLLVDDEEDFRSATTAVLERRGFSVKEAASGYEALEAIQYECPDIVLLDLKMPGMSGIETLQKIRELHTSLPVIILTGHGDFEAAVATINLSIVDFLQKPIDVDLLADRARLLLTQSTERVPLKERTISEIMVPPSVYPKINADEPVIAALTALWSSFKEPAAGGPWHGEVRSALVYDRNDRFLTIIRFTDLLNLLLPPFLRDSPYTTFFTGMFLAQCKVIGNRKIEELVGEPIVVDMDAPIMEAVHLMIAHRLINLPVVRSGELVGILRARDIVLEVARCMGAAR